MRCEMEGRREGVVARKERGKTGCDSSGGKKGVWMKAESESGGVDDVGGVDVEAVSVFVVDGWKMVSNDGGRGK